MIDRPAKDRDAADAAAVLAWLEAHPDVGDALAQGYQGSVRRVATPFGEVVVKQPHPHAWLGRLVRASVARELEVYGRLAGIPGIGACFGLVGDSLVLEYIPSQSYRERQHDLVDRDAFFSQLEATLERMHAAGVAHADLKRKDNLLVGPDEQPYIVDFGIACIRRTDGGGLNRLWFDWAQQTDWNAWLKLKYGRGLNGMSAVDAARYRPLAIERLTRALRRLRRSG